MRAEQLEQLFLLNGYDKILSNLPEFVFYCRRERQGINVVHVIDYRQGLYISEDQYFHLKERIVEFFRQKGQTEIHVMSLILSADTEKAKRLCVNDSFCWVIDTVADRLIIHESQVADFYGWKNKLEDYLFALACNQENAGGQEAEQEMFRSEADSKKWDRQRIRNLPWVNIILVAVNVIVFLICTFTGDLLYNRGALSVMYVVKDKAYYRVLSAMFLHWDVNHLFSNMIVLYYVGEIVERRIGRVPYTAVYFLSGIVGNIFSMGYELLTKGYGMSAGASGAVFGVEGALLWLVMTNRGRLGSMTVGRVAFAVAFSLYCGFTSTNVNNAAHVGGVLMGFAAAAVICLMSSRGRIRKDNSL